MLRKRTKKLPPGRRPGAAGVGIFLLALLAVGACVWAIVFTTRPKSLTAPSPTSRPPAWQDIDASWIDFGQE